MKIARVAGAVVAVLLSGGAHLLGSAWFAEDAPLALDGGGEAAPARLGTAFADMVAGAPGTNTPETVTPVAPTDVTAVEPVQPTSADEAENTAADADSSQPTMAEQVASATPSTIAAVPSAEATTIEPTTPTAAMEVAAANSEDLLTPLVSPRPSRRPDDLAPPPPPDPPTPQTAASGNAASDTIRGSEAGSEDAPATITSPTPQPAPQAGDPAAIAAYPGQVMRQISRQGRPRLRHTGPDAIVAFRIGSNGALTGASISQSSGNAEFDRAGLSIVQRAAPFPPPPQGAQTSFSVVFGGR